MIIWLKKPKQEVGIKCRVIVCLPLSIILHKQNLSSQSLIKVSTQWSLYEIVNKSLEIQFLCPEQIVKFVST